MFHHGAPPLWLIPALPAFGALFIFLFSKKLTPRGAGAVACFAVIMSFLWVAFCSSLLIQLPNTLSFHQKLWTWVEGNDIIKGDIGFYFDRISLVFCLIITGVGSLIHLYSFSYMDGDEGERRYFGVLNLFVASMLVLVTANNAFFMFMGWEGVGACSFLLIGHWYQKSENAVAAQKAFLVTRLGDIFLLLGLFICAMLAGVYFPDLNGYEAAATKTIAGISGSTWITVAGILLLLGAAGKSANLPLHVWLPDAMAGPTPVSALIHAATMVTAGVYLLARFHTLIALSPVVMAAIAVIGVATAFYGATVAIMQTDIKRILAYSTISQIGYMILGLGVGAFSLGLFHFFTHAFYKALLFLAAGTVIHSLHGEQNIYNMGNLRNGKGMRGTFWAFMAGCAALAGIPLTSGFFSKDAILFASQMGPYGSMALYVVGLITAFLTAIYSFRLIFVVFFGPERKHHHIHPPGRLLTWPLYILAFFALFAGFLNIPAAFHVTPLWDEFFKPVFGHWQIHAAANAHTKEIMLALLSGLVAVAGVGVAWMLYGPTKAVIPAPAGDIGTVQTDTPAPYRSGVFNVAYHGWGFDAIYRAAFVRPFRHFAEVCRWVDRVLVDGVFELTAAITRGLHNVVIFFQNGRVPRYALVILFGAVAITTILLSIYPRLP